ncbi:hypothetical protein B0H13DRAFT_1951207 [Mycena leptocephala]|nr:hypothetical protein B0H13DRAFT_1951207 [Mycena leptocephala]
MTHGDTQRWIDVHEGLYDYRGPDSGAGALAYINEHQRYNRRWADVRAGGGMRSGISRGCWRQRGHDRTVTMSALSLAFVLSSHAVTVRRGMVSHARARSTSTQVRSLAHAMGEHFRIAEIYVQTGRATARARPRRNGSRIPFFQTFVLSLLDHG